MFPLRSPHIPYFCRLYIIPSHWKGIDCRNPTSWRQGRTCITVVKIAADCLATQGAKHQQPWFWPCSPRSTHCGLLPPYGDRGHHYFMTTTSPRHNGMIQPQHERSWPWKCRDISTTNWKISFNHRNLISNYHQILNWFEVLNWFIHYYFQTHPSQSSI